MAGYTSRIFLTLTVPSIFGFLSILWFLRKKNSNSKISKDNQVKDSTASENTDQLRFLYPMKLKSHEVSAEERGCAEMQLKETQSATDAMSNGITSQNPKVKGRKKNKSKLRENGSSCAVQEPTTNGHGKDSTSLKNEDSTSLRNGDSQAELTNGVKALNLRNEVESKSESSDQKILKEIYTGEKNGNGHAIVLNGKANEINSYIKSDAEASGLNGIVDDSCISSKNDTCTVENLEPEVAKEQCDIEAHQESLSVNSSCSTNLLLSSIDDTIPIKLAPDSAVVFGELSTQPENPSLTDCNGHLMQPTNCDSSDTNEPPTETLDADTDSKHLAPVEYIAHLDENSLPVDYLVVDTKAYAIVNGQPSLVNYVMTDGLVPLPGSFVPVEGQGEMLESPGTAYCDSLATGWIESSNWVNCLMGEAVMGSNDSGRGPSEIQFAVSESDSSLFYMVYEFEILPEDCGRLIGKNGRYVKYVNKQTNANILIKKHPLSSDKKICSITGTESEIDAALKLIRKRFPLDHFPHVTLAQLNVVPLPVQSPETLKLPLPEGVTFDANLCATVNPGHFFLQQPTHPTFHQLAPLTTSMTSFYNEVLEAPMVENPVKGNIVAAAVSCGWFRAEIEEVYETDECRVKFLDYGGYTTVKLSSIRQIWGDFLQIPFQATECFLAGIMPNDENGWTKESTGAFEELAQGQLLHGCIVAYSENKVPFVNLHRSTGVMSIFINQQLIDTGFARSIPPSEEESVADS